MKLVNRLSSYLRAMFQLDFESQLKRKIKESKAALEKAKDDEAYCAAMYGYRSLQVAKLVPWQDKERYLEVQLKELEMEAALDFSVLLLEYHAKRIRKLQGRLEGQPKTPINHAN